MVEIYANISNELRSAAEAAWKIATIQQTPLEMAQFLNIVTNYYDNKLNEEEKDYLQFYFNLMMEVMKRE